MALIKCVECGKEYSDKADACPNCGATHVRKNIASETKKKGNKFVIGFVIVAIVIMIAIFNNNNNNEADKITYAELSDFEYVINEDGLTLEKYNGDSETLIIHPNYEIDGKSYNVILLEHTIFNGSDIKALYIPKTIETIYDDTLAYLDAEDDKIQIYYEGSKKRWKKVFKHYDSSVSNGGKSKAEQRGAAAAEKFNKMLGHEYNANDFEYHFNANIEDIK